MTAVFHNVNINKEAVKPDERKADWQALEQAIIRADAVSNILQTVFEAFSNAQPLIDPEVDGLFDQVSYLQMELNLATTEAKKAFDDYLNSLKN